MKKIYTIIFGVIILVISILAVIGFFQKQNKTAQQQEETANNNQMGGSSPIPSGVNEAEFSANSQSELANQISSYIDSQLGSGLPSGEDGGLKDIRFKDDSGNPVTLGDFQQAVGIRIDSQLGKILKSGDYSFIICSGKGSEGGHGLILNIRLLAKNEEHPDVEKILASWEPSMLSDLKNILYRNVDFSSSDLSEKLSFKDGKYRYAELILENGKKINLNYAWVDDYVILATSLQCTDEMYNYVYGTD